MRLTSLGHGFGVYRREDGRLIIKWRDAHDRPRQTTTITKVAEANAFCRRKFREWPGRIETIDYTIREMVTEYLEEKELEHRAGTRALNTIIRDRAAVTRILEQWDGFHASELGRHDVKRWFSTMKAEGLSDSSVANYATVLRSAYKWAMDDGPLGHLTAHPVPSVAIKDQKAGQALTSIQIRSIFSATPTRYLPFMYTLAFSGMRIEEVCRLNVGDVNVEASTLFGGIKTDAGKDRTVAIPDWLTQLLVRHIGNRVSGPLFLNQRERRVNADVFRRRIWNPAVTKAGLPDATPHWLRHSLATLLAQSGHSVYDLRSHFGWADSRIADHYVKVAQAGIRSIADRLEEEIPDEARPGLRLVK